MYSPQLLDHFQNPRNAGEVLDPDATLQIENPACGDILKLSIRISDGRGLPEASVHSSHLALDAWAALLQQLKTSRR